MNRLIAGLALALAVMFLPAAPASAQRDSPTPPYPAICEEEPELRELQISTPTSEQIAMIDVPEGFFAVPVLAEGTVHERIIHVTNTSKTTMLVKVRIVGVDVPEFFTAEPTPVSFKVGLSPWVVSPETDDAIHFELQLLPPGHTRELEIGARMGWTDDRIVKEEGLAGIYRFDISAEADCRLASDPRYPDIPDNPSKDGEGTVEVPGSEDTLGPSPDTPLPTHQISEDRDGQNSTDTGASGREDVGAAANDSGAGDELVWTGADVRMLGFVAGILLVVGALLKRRRL